MRVVLDSKIYELKSGTGVTRTPLEEYSSPVRLDGQQRRKDKQGISSWAIDRWDNGLGIQKMNTEKTSDLYRLWEVDNCDTRYPSQITLSPDSKNIIMVPSRGDVRLPMQYMGNLYFVDTACPTKAIVHQWTPGSLNRIASIGELSSSALFGSVSSVRAFGDKIAFTGFDLNTNRQYFYMVPTLGDTAGEKSFDESDTGNVRPQIGDFGGTCHVLAYFPTKNRVNFYVADQALTVGSLHLVGTTSSSVGTYLAQLHTDGLKMYAMLPEGLYNFDETPNKIIDTGRSIDRNTQLALFQNYPYFKNKTSLVKYDGTDVDSIGYDREDGLPRSQWGEITAMCSSFQFLFAAVQGATYSHIYAMDNNNKWHYYTKVDQVGAYVENMFLSDLPDGFDRLWCVLGGSYSAPNYIKYYRSPMVNPLSAGTYNFVYTGSFIPPMNDGGIPEEEAGYFDMVVTADGMVGTNSITVRYGINGEDPSTATLGRVSTTNSVLVFGSPYGVAAHRIQPRFDLSQYNVGLGSTPIFRSAVIHYLKQKTREVFDYVVDIDKTANEWSFPPEAVLGSLDYIRDKKTLSSFWYGSVGTKHIRMMQPQSDEDIDNTNEIFDGSRTGFIKMRVVEGI